MMKCEFKYKNDMKYILHYCNKNYVIYIKYLKTNQVILEIKNYIYFGY